MMDDPAVFNNFMRNTLAVTNQQKIDVIKNSVESFGKCLAVINVDINNFVKDTYSENNSRLARQRILISNNVPQGLNSMFLS